jgi:hypothetical protein
MGLLNDMIRELADEHEGVVVVDLAAWVEGLPPGEDERLRPDGVHFELDTAVEVADWLAPQVRAAVLSERPPGAPPVGGPAPAPTTLPDELTTPTTAAPTTAGAAGS